MNKVMFDPVKLPVHLQSWLNIISGCRTDTESVLHVLMSGECVQILYLKALFGVFNWL